MITFTKEQLIASAHSRIEFAEMMLSGELEPLKERTWSIELELARIAQAALQQEPVASFYRDGIVAAAAWVDKQREVYDNEHGRHDPGTGFLSLAAICSVIIQPHWRRYPRALGLCIQTLIEPHRH